MTALTLRDRNRRIVTDFYTKAFVQLDHEGAVRDHLAADYIQHNPFVPDGVDGFLDFFAKFDAQREAGSEQRILRVIADEDLVAVHATMHSSQGDAVLVDIFHVTPDGKIDEHWDVFKELADPATIPHSNGEIGDVVKVKPRQGDAEYNRWALTDFYTTAFIQKRFAKAADKHFGSVYVQHNSFVPDGAEAFLAHFGAPDGPHASETYTQIPLRFIVDDEYGVVHEWLRPNVADADDPGVLIVDIFRFRDGKIVEHWDVFTRRWSAEESANSRGML